MQATRAAVKNLSHVRSHGTGHADEPQGLGQGHQYDGSHHRSSEAAGTADDDDGDDEDRFHDRETRRIDKADMVGVDHASHRRHGRTDHEYQHLVRRDVLPAARAKTSSSRIAINTRPKGECTSLEPRA